MVEVKQIIMDGYKYLFEELPNPITRNWFLVSRPFEIIGLMAIYLFFSTRLGPWYMRDKKPYNLKKVIKYYNILQVLASLYIFSEGVKYMLSKEFSLVCQNVDDPTTPRALNIAKATYWYFMIKIIDLLDTVFFVLRKSDRQITSLHLHHHTLMPLATWVGITYFPGGQAVILGTLNAFVHAVMYGYYYIAGLGEKYKKYLWWKRHVTELQLLQFILIGTHAFNSLFYECGYPTWIKLSMICYAGIFINMFGQFYYKCFILSKPQQNGKPSQDVNVEYSNGLKKEKDTNGDTIKTTREGMNVNNNSSNEFKSNYKTQ